MMSAHRLISFSVEHSADAMFHLTEHGFSKLESYFDRAEGENFNEYMSSRIENSSDTFYCQIPFKVSPAHPTIAVDLREDEEVLGQLSNSISSGRDASGSAVNFWK